MKKFEYIAESYVGVSLKEFLNKRGNERWELVIYDVNTNKYIFKREIIKNEN